METGAAECDAWTAAGAGADQDAEGRVLGYFRCGLFHAADAGEDAKSRDTAAYRLVGWRTDWGASVWGDGTLAAMEVIGYGSLV